MDMPQCVWRTKNKLIESLPAPCSHQDCHLDVIKIGGKHLYPRNYLAGPK